MTVPEILKELELHTGKFPLAAMRAACEQREAITPELLRVMEDVAANGPAYAARQHYMLHTFATYLLAQFRDRRLFQPLLTIVTLPGELPFDLYGDTITEGLSRLFGSVYAGDPAPLQRAIENPAVNEFVRSAALDSLLLLERTGQMSRDEVVNYFRDLFHGKLERTPSQAWVGLVCACADLPAPELLGEIQAAYAEGLVNEWCADLESIEADLQTPREDKPDWKEKRWTLITDAIDEMEWWASFHPEPPPRTRFKRLPKPIRPIRLPEPNPSTATRAAPTPGRNDPCPCGSGRKYKKCCLA